MRFKGVFALHEIGGNFFEWDEEKHEANIRKHGVDFWEAATVLRDPYAVFYFDEEHSYYEERFKVIGYSENQRMLMVCHCYRNGDSYTRIFSARKATKQEHKDYWG